MGVFEIRGGRDAVLKNADFFFRKIFSRKVHFPNSAKRNDSVFQGMDGVVFADTNVFPGKNEGPALAHDNNPDCYSFTVLVLDAEVFRV